ncbi:TonB-dependent receptor [Chromobacterium violaceum]|uniref:TonB-dependent receptor n=1 Tax=Chromobacterium violaceum TaxID=536 RepID=UPI001CB5C507|nr:TonB-dependent receptor [Chromobacterium violaceum]STB70758.1 Colicin I receptor precursor [Chromobacterium violaceum]
MRKKQLVVALAMAGIGVNAPMAWAADEAASGELDRVEVTGSNIKRSIKQEKALPVTIVRTEEMTKQGFTTVEQVVNSLASNQSNLVGASSVQSVSGGASYAGLRGFDPQYTLVLLDGRRVANQAISGVATDLNAIPLSAIDRIEVLRDGASALYGSDAIGGVMNFITKKSYQGLTISGEAQATQHKGGDSANVSLLGGVGDLAKDGWNAYGVLSYQKSKAIKTIDRDFATKNQSLSSITYPANFLYQAAGKPGDGNVYNASMPGCRPPYTTPRDATSCGEKTWLFMDLTPEVEQFTANGKLSKQFGDHMLTAQYLGARNISTTRIGPTPMQSIATLTAGVNKYFPTVLPDGSPVTPGAKAVLNLRSDPLGPRTTKSTSDTHRLAVNLEGLLGGWDYRTGAAYSSNQTTINYKSGYVNGDKIEQALLNDQINPFGDSPAGAWENVELKGDGWISKYETALADFKASKELFALPAGNLAAAFGGELRHEKLDSQIQDLAQYAVGSGIADSKSTKGSRNISALYLEADVPVIKGLDIQLAARYDKYSDFGKAFNPKVAFKYQPAPQILFRGSASRGFRAPSLFDVFQPDAKTYTNGNNLNDPVLCPNGTPANGGDKTDCGTTFFAKQGGNRNLEPERASSLTFGVVIEPIREITASVDFWWTTINKVIGVLDNDLIFNDPVKYANRFVRVNPNDPYSKLDYVSTPTENLGNLSAAGLDTSFSWRLPRSRLGNFTINLDGTYTSKFVQQVEAGGIYYSRLSQWNNGLQPVVRWKHSLGLNWSLGNWSALLAQNYVSGYTDYKATHSVKPYSNWNLSSTYLWQKKLSVTAGVKNLFDQEPPFSNQNKFFQKGFDPILADPVGRAFFLKASYKL